VVTTEPAPGSSDSKVHKDTADSSADAAAAPADKSEELDVAITIDETPKGAAAQQGASSQETSGADAGDSAAPMSASKGNTGSTLPFDQL
jgi:hypothetical protein